MVTFYEIGSDGKPTKPVLYLDTLKVSTIEQTAEQTEARGGKGNPPLIIWDYGKEINVTLEDALFSAKSMAIMFGNGSLKDISGTPKLIMRTEEFTATSTGSPSAATLTTTSPFSVSTTGSDGAGWKHYYEDNNGKLYEKLNPKFYDASGSSITTTSVSAHPGEKIFCSYDLLVADAKVVEISASSFPGTYYVTGDTYARSSITGMDEFFQFIIPKAKMNAENTITLEAEGDPSVFNMSLRVMRPDDGIMMKLVKYDLANATDASVGATSDIIHNHELTPKTTQA